MTQRLKIAASILYVIAAIAVAYGLVYFFIPTLFPYHRRYLGEVFEGLDRRVISLYLLIYRGVGAAMVSIGVTLALLVRFFLRRGSRGGWWAILTMMMLVLVPLLFITYSVGPYTPWWGIGILILAVGGALAVARKDLTAP